MITDQELEKFVSSDLLDGENLVYTSGVKKPAFKPLKFLKGIIVLLIFLAMLFILPENIIDLTPDKKLVIAAIFSISFVLLTILWSIAFYDKSYRRIVATTSLRFIIYEYSKELHKLDEEKLQFYESKKEITFDAIESMKLSEDKDNTGVLIMVFDQENEEKSGYELAKMHLRVGDCKAIREAIPQRMRPEGSKEDYWERTYDD